MIKALFIIWSLEKGGAEKFLVSLLKNIDREKIEPVVCCLNWKGMWAEELEKKGIQVIALNKKGKIDVKAFVNLIKIIKKGKFQIVNTHLWGADVIGRLAAIFAKAPIIISTLHNTDNWKKWWHRVIDRLLCYKTNIFIAVSEAVKKYYNTVGIPLSKITYIPNAIEISSFDNVGDVRYLYDEIGLTAKNFILVCIGRLSKEKGQRYLLKSISLLRSKYPHINLLLVGYGEEEIKLKELANNLNITDMVRFLGYRSDIPQILRIADGLILPSLYEGLPSCVLEAMAASKPVIATKVGGTQDLIIDKETGFLVPPSNTEALASAIENLINLPDKGQKIGKKSREIVVNNFSISSAAQKTTNLFLDLTKKM